VTLAVALAFAAPASPTTHTDTPDNPRGCERTYKLAPFKHQLARSFSAKRWRDKTPVRPAERRRLHRMKRCAATPWHARRMRELEREARDRHRDRRRARLEHRRRMRCGSPECNKYLAKHRVRVSDAEHGCRLTLNTRESGWEETARNPHSGAYGIPQALPPSKMGAQALGSGWRAALAQLRWQLGYVVKRFGGFCRALAFHNAHGWY